MILTCSRENKNSGLRSDESLDQISSTLTSRTFVERTILAFIGGVIFTVFDKLPTQVLIIQLSMNENIMYVQSKAAINIFSNPRTPKIVLTLVIETFLIFLSHFQTSKPWVDEGVRLPRPNFGLTTQDVNRCNLNDRGNINIISSPRRKYKRDGITNSSNYLRRVYESCAHDRYYVSLISDLHM